MPVLVEIALFFAVCIGLWGVFGVLVFIGVCLLYGVLLALFAQGVRSKRGVDREQNGEP